MINSKTTPFIKRASTIAVSVLAISTFTGFAFAQDDETSDQPEPPARPIFTVLPNLSPAPPAPTGIPTWNGSYVYQNVTRTYTMVGTDAFSTNTSTTIPVVIIPVKIVISGIRGSQTFDPMSIPGNTGGLTALQNTIMSPMFDSSTTYIQGGTNVGTTQYIDAYQRANFFGTVSGHSNYHLLLGAPVVMPEVTLTPPSRRDGKTGAPFGETVAEVNINWIDGQFQSLITSLGITPNQLPIFMTYKTYLTQGSCCIGGYHSATGSQTYMHFTYIDQPGLFSQDVSALSHEVGEWADDPFVNNTNTPCGILENGDPLEGGPNFGGFPYPLHGFTFNLQDLVTLPYFGAPPSTSVNNFFTFQGQTLSVCQNGS
jgi:hypothetical protein